ncbi:MAG TPA: hypothetical protein IAC09_06480 [Candidatus Cryptobacteroides intestinipullorum]|nr:hypothetical protein [Candidatus Cryptobacteroides intestinipullorum]
MKKYIFSFVAMAAAVMGCNKAEIDEPQTDAASGGETYTIEATISSTKTTYAPPYTVTWDDDDALSVIASLDGAYSGHRFNKGEGNIFTESESEMVAYDNMSVIYPYDASFASLDAEGYTTAPVTISSGKQSGVGTGTHIDAPLYGYTTKTSVEMHHATTLFAVTVNNTSSESIAITNITLKNDQEFPMTGTFYISPSDGTLKAAEAVAEASLDVTDAVIGAGQTGTFYLSSAPFTLNLSQRILIDITVNGEVKSYEKYMSGSSPFVAGGINNTTVIISGATESQHELIYQFTNKGITKLDYSFEYGGGAQQTDYFIVSVDGADVTDYDAVYYTDFRFEAVDMTTGSPVTWTYAVRTGGHNSFTIGCDGNEGETARTAKINVYFDNTDEYVVVGTYKSVPAELEAISEGEPILTFTVTQEAKQDEPVLPEGDVLEYVFENKGISLHWSTELPSAAEGQIGSGWYGCRLNGADIGDTRNDPCYSALTFKAFGPDGQEVSWLSAVCGRLDSPGEMNGFTISYSANTSAEPRTATLKAYYTGEGDYTISTTRHTSAEETETLILEDPATEPVYELIVTQPGAAE